MPPSPGKIHQLPVKVLYSIDTSSQSYLTVLHDRQDVYVHPSSPNYATSEEQGKGLVGSCTLKAIARGICYASPECIPNTTSLDFSVYNLDPTVRRLSTSSSSRAFPSSPSEHPSSSTSSWVGRGFLSWVLSENGNGSTLIKGRLVREYEFSSIHFAPEGGLEGLMAMANSNGGGTDGEDSDGKGWGLEVGISLRQLNPDGKIEFQNRKEFEEMLSKGKSTSISASSPIRGNSTIGGGSTPARSSPLINSTINRTPNVNSTPQHPGPSASSTATIRPPPIAQPTPVPAQQQQQQQQSGQSSRPSSSLSHRPSSSSIPPSSLPPLPSSSNSNVPSSRPSSSIGESRPPPPVPPQQQAEAGPSRNREVTPPPVPRSKSPPPSTPSRHKLHALLRADGMMSPELARHLASNPVLRNLLKAVPSNSNALTALRNITGANKSPTSNANANGAKRSTTNDKDKEKEDSPEATTPTPLPTPQRTTRSTQQGQSNQDGCCNCGTMVSACWRVKKMKDGTPRKVCDDCGLYFNEHKKMRPPELWSQSFKPGQSSTSSAQQQQNGGGEKRKHAIELSDGPASGLRSSPRLNRTNSDQQTHTQSQNQSQSENQNQIPESPRKRQKLKSHGNPPPPSPRRSTRNSSKNDNVDFGAEVFGFSPSTSNSNNNSIFGTSPAIPITSNNSQDHQQQQHHHQMQSFGQSMSGHTHGNGHNGNGSGNGNLEELDISAFLATFENSLAHTSHHTSTNGTGIGTGTGLTDGQGVEENNFNFDSLFNGDSSMGIELSQEMQDLLNGWESQLNDPNYLAGLDVNIPGLGDIGNEPGQ